MADLFARRRRASTNVIIDYTLYLEYVDVIDDARRSLRLCSETLYLHGLAD